MASILSFLSATCRPPLPAVPVALKVQTPQLWTLHLKQSSVLPETPAPAAGARFPLLPLQLPPYVLRASPARVPAGPLEGFCCLQPLTAAVFIISALKLVFLEPSTCIFAAATETLVALVIISKLWDAGTQEKGRACRAVHEAPGHTAFSWGIGSPKDCRGKKKLDVRSGLWRKKNL